MSGIGLYLRTCFVEDEIRVGEILPKCCDDMKIVVVGENERKEQVGVCVPRDRAIATLLNVDRVFGLGGELFYDVDSLVPRDVQRAVWDVMSSVVDVLEYLDLISRKFAEQNLYDESYGRAAGRVLALKLACEASATIARRKPGYGCGFAAARADKCVVSVDKFESYNTINDAAEYSNGVLEADRGEGSRSVTNEWNDCRFYVVRYDDATTADYLSYSTRVARLRVLVTDAVEYTRVCAHADNRYLTRWLENYDYFALRTYEKNYLMRCDVTARVFETPVLLMIRVALELCTPVDEELILKTKYPPLRNWRTKHNCRYFDQRSVLYEDFCQIMDAMYEKRYIHATPTLFTAGCRTEEQQLSSCFLHGCVPNDAPYDSTFDAICTTARVMQRSGGVGICASKHGNVVGLARALESMMDVVRQRRPAAMTVYLDVANIDVFRFLELRRNVGSTEEQCRKLFTAVMLSDEFVRRVIDDERWTLFEPSLGNTLLNVYGETYTARYRCLERCVDNNDNGCRTYVEGRDFKRTTARLIFRRMMRSQIETGMPFVCYRDAINRMCSQVDTYVKHDDRDCFVQCGNTSFDADYSPWNAYGKRRTIVCSNLCTEIAQYSDEHEFGVCNLASLGLPVHVLESNLNFGEYDELVNSNVALSNLVADATWPFASNAVKVEPTARVDCEASVQLLCRYLERGYDWNRLERDVYLSVRMLNRALVRTNVPVVQAERGLFHQRAVALGVQGFAETLRTMRMPYDGWAARVFNVALFKFIYSAAVRASCDVYAVENQTMSAASTEDDARFCCADDFLSRPFDHHGLSRLWMKMRSDQLRRRETDGCSTWPKRNETGAKHTVLTEAAISNETWLALDECTTRHCEFLRRFDGGDESRRRANSLLIGLMPTATTAQLLGHSESFDPLYSNLFRRNTLAGDFIQFDDKMLNHVVRSMNNSMSASERRTRLLRHLLEHNGSIQRMSDVPSRVKRLYTTAWEISMRACIDLCADRQAYVDQTQSMSLYMKQQNCHDEGEGCSASDDKKSNNRLFLALVYGWARNLKTGMYYLRTQGNENAADTLDISRVRVDKNDERRPSHGTTDNDDDDDADDGNSVNDSMGRGEDGKKINAVDGAVDGTVDADRCEDVTRYKYEDRFGDRYEDGGEDGSSIRDDDGSEDSVRRYRNLNNSDGNKRMCTDESACRKLNYRETAAVEALVSIAPRTVMCNDCCG